MNSKKEYSLRTSSFFILMIPESLYFGFFSLFGCLMARGRVYSIKSDKLNVQMPTSSWLPLEWWSKTSNLIGRFQSLLQRVCSLISKGCQLGLLWLYTKSLVYTRCQPPASMDLDRMNIGLNLLNQPDMFSKLSPCISRYSFSFPFVTSSALSIIFPRDSFWSFRRSVFTSCWPGAPTISPSAQEVSPMKSAPLRLPLESFTYQTLKVK